LPARAVHKAIHLLSLGQANGRLHVGHAVVEAHEFVQKWRSVLKAWSRRFHASRATSSRLVVTIPPSPVVMIFVAIETEGCRISQGCRRAAFVDGPMSLGSVLQHEDAVPAAISLSMSMSTAVAIGMDQYDPPWFEG